MKIILYKNKTFFFFKKIRKPQSINIFFFKKRFNNFLWMYNNLGIFCFKLNKNIKIDLFSNSFFIMRQNFFFKNKITTNLLNTYFTIIKTFFFGLFKKYWLRLQLVGKGLKLNLENFFFLKFKLGHSHQVIIKIPLGVFVKIGHRGGIFLRSRFYKLLTSTAKKIKTIKPLSPYKLKGITFYKEKIKLKIVKKQQY